MHSEDITRHVADLRGQFTAGRTRSLNWRVKQLRALKAMVDENSDAILAALKSDLGKPSFEAWAGELAMVLRELKSGSVPLLSTNPASRDSTKNRWVSC